MSNGKVAEAALSYVTDTLIPELTGGRDVKLYMGGCSLAAFFSLWAAYRTDLFSGICAASPSVWFPGWIDHAENHSVQADRIYLSLGDREERTRDTVKTAIIYLVIINIAAFCMYGMDKSAAIKHKQRIPNKVLILE